MTVTSSQFLTMKNHTECLVIQVNLFCTQGHLVDNVEQVKISRKNAAVQYVVIYSVGNTAPA